jgi:poly-gamma-glutamate capsule biosynthesis protein CapA/YwtB (metallophosphatase superfamily)
MEKRPVSRLDSTTLFSASRFLRAFRQLIGICLLTCSASSLSGQSNDIRLIFAGDIMMHQSQIDAAERKDGTYDFSSVFQYVSPLLKEADLVIGNLELTLPGKSPYAGYPNFRSPDTLAHTLLKAGFDILVTSNNHSNDAKTDGIVHTIEALHRKGIISTGTFVDSSDRAERYPLVIEKKGFRIGLLNYTYGTNDPNVPEPCIVNLIDTLQIKDDLKALQKKEPDIIIAFMHWGDEYHLDENEKQQHLTWMLFKSGVDLVIGAHPHVAQPVKLLHEYHLDGLRQGLVAYSLGNAVSGQVRANTDMGLLLEVTYRRDLLTREVQLRNHYYLPIWRYRGWDEEGRRVISILPVSAFEEDDPPFLLRPSDRERMNSVTKRIRKHLKRYHSSERRVSLHAWKRTTKK